MTRAAAPAPRPPDTADGVRRGGPGRVIAGVCVGIARWLGVRTVTVRVIAVVLAIVGGVGLVLYAIAWLVLPPANGPSVARRLLVGRTRARTFLGALAVTVVLALALATLGGPQPSAFLTAIGLTVLWRQGLLAGTELRRSRTSSVLSIVLGTVVVLSGLLQRELDEPAGAPGLGAPGRGAVALLAVVVGVALVFAPTWWRLARDLAAERRARVRSQERAEIAARVHDGVLQTLALIQKQADDPRAVATLARAQERELRGWLFEGDAPRSDESTASALTAEAARVEQAHRVEIDVVTVGDLPLTPAREALVHAAGEALTNAAKWAGADRIALYAELGEAGATVFVRDRGGGFDPGAVAPDRRGLRESIHGRMARHGGTATVTSAPGAGTEVELAVPSAEASQS